MPARDVAPGRALRAEPADVPRSAAQGEDDEGERPFGDVARCDIGGAGDGDPAVAPERVDVDAVRAGAELGDGAEVGEAFGIGAGEAAEADDDGGDAGVIGGGEGANDGEAVGAKERNRLLDLQEGGQVLEIDEIGIRRGRAGGHRRRAGRD